MLVDFEGLTRAFVDAQLQADRHEALRLLMEDGLERGAPVPDLLQRVIRPAQQEIGRLWQNNRITVADEHAATAIAQLVMAQIYGHAVRQADSGRRVVVACVEGERHDLGARIAADLLDLAGHEVTFLGADVPIDSLVDAVQRRRAHLVVLSITMAFHAAALVRTVRALRERIGQTLPIAAGGAALPLCHDVVEPLALVATGEDAATLLAGVARHFDRPTQDA